MKPSRQSGFALLIFVIMLMSIGGFVLVGYGQSVLKEVEVKRFEHNKRVLGEAKAALLLYAHKYPDFNAQGPGRLPCPYDEVDGYSGGISEAICEEVGRFPRLTVNLDFFNETKDASGEYLWYAVSEEFRNVASTDLGANTNGDLVVNSDSAGTISIFDQTGALVYDGNASGVAAVIIAPGANISRDNNGNGTYDYTQIRGTVAQQNDPINYLDTFNNFDNSDFLNAGNNDADGFILGPVFESDSNSAAHNTVVVNDQFIIVTAQEVIDVAEKAVLGAYRDSIDDYLNVAGACTGGTGGTNKTECITNGGAWAGVYPWLYNYNNIAALSDFPANLVGATEFANNLAPGNFGRIPSIFTDYFTETTGQPINTRLDVSVSLTFPLTPATVASSASGLLQFNGICSGESPPLNPPTNAANCASNAGSFTPKSTAFNLLSTGVLTGVQFLDIADVVGQDGQLAATVGVGDEDNVTQEFYFWDNDEVAPTGIWTLCEDDGDGIPQVTDCNRTGGVPNPGGTQDTNSEILHVTVEFDTSGVINFDTDYTTPPVISAPVAATGTSHASISATFAGANIISSPLTISYEIDRHYHANFDIEETGTLDFGDLNLIMTLGMRYYPELPDWAFSNGWYDSLMMAYAVDYLPSSVSVPKDCAATPPCIQVNGSGGTIDDKISILTLAGQHNWIDDAPLNDFRDDIGDVFDAENADINDVDGTEYLFDKRAQGGNDKILIIDEL